jgi:hypothetical protein
VYHRLPKTELPAVFICAVVMLLFALALFSPAALSATRLRVNSVATTKPPVIDGKITPGEWSNVQISMGPPSYPIEACAYFLNDRTNLYILVDAPGDATDNPGDSCLFWFNYQGTVSISIAGMGGTIAGGAYAAAVGFNGHKFYEFSVPFSYMSAGPGQTIDICSPSVGKPSIVYDAHDGRDNVWPAGLDHDRIDTWGLLYTNQRANVGGMSLPTNPVLVLAPYLAVIGLIATAAIVYGRKRTY